MQLTVTDCNCSFCKQGAHYFLRRTAPWGDEPGDLGGRLSTSCFIYDDPGDGRGRDGRVHGSVTVT